MAQPGADYATVAQLQTRLGRNDDGTFGDLLNAASRAVEAFTHRQFHKATTATERLFRALDPERCPVDDFYTTTDLAIEVDGTAWALTDVQLRPPNGVVNGVPGWPFTDLLAVGRSFPPGRRALVAVTARWGWAAVPEAIVQATLDVAEIGSYSRSSTGVVRSESETLAAYSHAISYSTPTLTAESVPPEFAKAAPYRRTRFGVA